MSDIAPPPGEILVDSKGDHRRTQSESLARTRSEGDIDSRFRAAATHLSDAQVRDWFDHLDIDKDGGVTMEEFVSATVMHEYTGLGEAEALYPPFSCSSSIPTCSTFLLFRRGDCSPA